MRDPFAPKKRWSGWTHLMNFDSWVDDAMYRFKSSGADYWESITIFFRRFRVYGFKKFITELLCEGLTVGAAGAVLMFALAKPAFVETDKNWRAQQEYSVLFLDRFGNEIGRRGVLHNDAEPINALPDHFIKAVLATEDRRFFEHIGIDFFGLVRAMVENAKANSVVSSVMDDLSSHCVITSISANATQRSKNEGNDIFTLPAPLPSADAHAHSRSLNLYQCLNL